MCGKDLQPSRELLDKVMLIANTKKQLPLSERGRLNVEGVYCQVNRLPSGVLFYQAGAKFSSRLRFELEKDGRIIVRKYHSGSWESKIDVSYGIAKSLDDIFTLAGQTADRKNVMEVVKRLEELKTKYETSSFFYFALGKAYLDTGRHQLGCESIVTSLKIGLVDPNHELSAFGMLVHTVEKEELAVDIQKLVKQLEELTVERPQSAIAWTILGRVCWVSGQFKEAENAFARAISICPTNALYHYNLSATYSIAYFNAKGHPMSAKEFRLRHGDLRLPPSLLELGEEEEEFRSCEKWRRLTSETLGYSQNAVRRLAEKHTREVLRLSQAEEEEPLRKAAREQLVTLRMADQL